MWCLLSTTVESTQGPTLRPNHRVKIGGEIRPRLNDSLEEHTVPYSVESSPKATELVAWSSDNTLSEQGATDMSGRFDTVRREALSIVPGKDGGAIRRSISG